MFSNRLTESGQLLRPGIANGHYPQRSPESPSWLPRMMHSVGGLLRSFDSPSHGFGRTLARINHHGGLLEDADETMLSTTTDNLRIQLHKEGMTDDLLCQAFALIRETAGRTLNMRHFDSQLMGGWVMVQGQLAEMETGEGKTLTATLAAAAAALAGIPVHVVTVNDFLVTRDSALMAPIYKALGLRVGSVTADMEPAARRAAYGCDITYCTNKQLAFDYLRDRILLDGDHGRLRLQLERLHNKDARAGRLFLRGLCFAIIDEADSVLIDEARTPLIISRKVEQQEEERTYRQAMELAGRLQQDRDFSIDFKDRTVHISDAGKEYVSLAAESLDGIWRSTRSREELICQALSANHLYTRDRHYLVNADSVQIIDENTGRVMADRTWSRGLHQMIEIKEDCKVSGRQEHLARLTYQRFFRRYLRLSGMTGTAREVRKELWSVYQLPVRAIPTNKPSRRLDLGRRTYGAKTEKWAAVVRRIHELWMEDRPVLVGTASVADSEHLSTLLRNDGFDHQVLNARQDEREAEIIALAGQQGCITIATNMAGRGTDIKLGEGVADSGGLHVISTERNEAGRIDRQLFGRCGRQGDPGSYEVLISLEDDLIQQHLNGHVLLIFKRLLSTNDRSAQKTFHLAACFAQSERERHHLRMRRDLLRMDDHLSKLLAFSGQLE